MIQKLDSDIYLMNSDEIEAIKSRLTDEIHDEEKYDLAQLLAELKYELDNTGRSDSINIVMEIDSINASVKGRMPLEVRKEVLHRIKGYEFQIASIKSAESLSPELDVLNRIRLMQDDLHDAIKHRSDAGHDQMRFRSHQYGKKGGKKSGSHIIAKKDRIEQRRRRAG
ncbi:hypothetical protein KJ652_01460 [Patescibacteria group bacterium]|nr:hypothetical protein [Patescibacteria group bacterium]MBU1123236.1 hypothetical protein [Patescibacteria group bacterium]MBU1910958.1 hypothetical protein [Patescibacteria group bacterium]